MIQDLKHLPVPAGCRQNESEESRTGPAIRERELEMNRQEITAFLEAWMTGDPEQDDAWLALQCGELFMTEKIIDLNMAVIQVLLNDVIRKNENLILAELDTGPQILNRFLCIAGTVKKTKDRPCLSAKGIRNEN